jgi:uncharacterized membrane protein YfcA
MSIFLTLLCGSVVGISLGLTGGGGSIFAVPLLLYVLGFPLREAVMVSLAVVGLTALYGAFMQRQLVLWRAGAVLGAGGILGAPVGAALGKILPGEVILLVFAGLMGLIGWRMWQGRGSLEIPLEGIACQRDADGILRFHWSCAGKLVIAGLLTGLLSGLFGVGGGFLVVPTLLAVTGMPLPKALATSLIAIFLISLAGFGANYWASGAFPLTAAGWFLLGGVGGMSFGTWGKTFLPTATLGRIFAGAIIAVGAIIFWVEIGR